jgi:hypothetical protein
MNNVLFFTFMRMQKSGHKEWRGHPYALDQRGELRKNGTPT